MHQLTARQPVTQAFLCAYCGARRTRRRLPTRQSRFPSPFRPLSQRRAFEIVPLDRVLCPSCIVWLLRVCACACGVNGGRGVFTRCVSVCVRVTRYAPFNIIRDPPGGGSTTTWTRGDSTQVSLSYAKDFTEKNEIFADVKMKPRAGTRGNMGFSWGALAAASFSMLKFLVGVDLKTKMKLQASASGVHSDGTLLTVTAQMDYTTSSNPLLAGTASDLYVTPVSGRRQTDASAAVFDPWIAADRSRSRAAAAAATLHPIARRNACQRLWTLSPTQKRAATRPDRPLQCRQC